MVLKITLIDSSTNILAYIDLNLFSESIHILD